MILPASIVWFPTNNLTLSSKNFPKTISDYNCFAVHRALKYISKDIISISNLRDGNLLLLVNFREVSAKFIKVTSLPGLYDIECKLHDTLNFVKGTIYAPWDVSLVNYRATHQSTAKSHPPVYHAISPPPFRAMHSHFLCKLHRRTPKTNKKSSFREARTIVKQQQNTTTNSTLTYSTVSSQNPASAILVKKSRNPDTITITDLPTSSTKVPFPLSPTYPTSRTNPLNLAENLTSASSTSAKTDISQTDISQPNK